MHYKNNKHLHLCYIAVYVKKKTKDEKGIEQVKSWPIG